MTFHETQQHFRLQNGQGQWRSCDWLKLLIWICGFWKDHLHPRRGTLDDSLAHSFDIHQYCITWCPCVTCLLVWVCLTCVISLYMRLLQMCMQHQTNSRVMTINRSVTKLWASYSSRPSSFICGVVDLSRKHKTKVISSLPANEQIANIQKKILFFFQMWAESLFFIYQLSHTCTRTHMHTHSSKSLWGKKRVKRKEKWGMLN